MGRGPKQKEKEGQETKGLIFLHCLHTPFDIFVLPDNIVVLVLANQQVLLKVDNLFAFNWKTRFNDHSYVMECCLILP